MKKYVIYRRVSSEMQGESGLGLEGQLPIIKHFTKDGKIIADFVEVQSAKNTRRPELQKAISITKSEGAILVVAKADRLSRDVRDALEILDNIGDKNLLCCDCPETNRLMITMIFAFAEHERLLISIRTKSALAAKKERQLIGTDRNAPSGRVKGFKHSAETKAKISLANKQASEKIDQKTVKLVKMLYTQHGSLAAVAHEMTDLGHTAPKGGKLSPTQIRRFLNS